MRGVQPRQVVCGRQKISFNANCISRAANARVDFPNVGDPSELFGLNRSYGMEEDARGKITRALTRVAACTVITLSCAEDSPMAPTELAFRIQPRGP